MLCKFLILQHFHISFSHNLALLFQCQKFIDPVNTNHSRLNGLNLHSKAFYRSKNLGNVIDHSHSSSRGHSKEGQYRLISGRRKQYHNRNHNRIQDQNYRRIHRIIEIGPLHCLIALTNIGVITLFHIFFPGKTVDGADVVQGLRNMAGSSSHCFSVFNLSGQHVFLHMSGEPKQEGQHYKKHHCKSLIFKPDYHQDTDNLAGIYKHTNDS